MSETIQENTVERSTLKEASIIKPDMFIPKKTPKNRPFQKSEQQHQHNTFPPAKKKHQLVGANHPHLVATLCSSFSRENGHIFLICSSLSTAQHQFFPPGNRSNSGLHFCASFVFGRSLSMVSKVDEKLGDQPLGWVKTWPVFKRRS